VDTKENCTLQDRVAIWLTKGSAPIDTVALTDAIQTSTTRRSPEEVSRK